ncbi:UNVERIFIED_CONTAM: hypothetical protein FKN15_075127 [Acipenser sinensis]
MEKGALKREQRGESIQGGWWREDEGGSMEQAARRREQRALRREQGLMMQGGGRDLRMLQTVPDGFLSDLTFLTVSLLPVLFNQIPVSSHWTPAQCIETSVCLKGTERWKAQEQTEGGSEDKEELERLRRENKELEAMYKGERLRRGETQLTEERVIQ